MSSYRHRGNDPGPEIWASVGQWAIDTLGMSDGGAGYVVESGRRGGCRLATLGVLAKAPEFGRIV